MAPNPVASIECQEKYSVIQEVLMVISDYIQFSLVFNTRKTIIGDPTINNGHPKTIIGDPTINNGSSKPLLDRLSTMIHDKNRC
jgi:hypothetical protein